MEQFTAEIDGKFSIKEVSKILKKSYPLIHRSMKDLIKKNFLKQDSKKLISLNYKDNYAELSYIESLRKRSFINKDKTNALIVKNILDRINVDFFIFLIFGSLVFKKTGRDLDILIIIENKDEINEIEKTLSNIVYHFTKKMHIHVISKESVYEMFSKRDNINLMNETLNNHILLFGAENYYRILKNAR